MITQKKLNEFTEIVHKEIIKQILLKNENSSCLHSNDTLSKNINGKIVTKKSVRKKDWSYDWVENVKVEDIDLEYFNKDYTKKKRIN
jgi:hypothetical protein